MSEAERAACWLATATTAGLLLYRADTHGYPFCDSVRWAFRTHTPGGRLAVTTALAGITLGFRRHLLKSTA